MNRLILFRKIPNSLTKALHQKPFSAPINLCKALKQHHNYINTVVQATMLENVFPRATQYANTSWITLPHDNRYPDCCFVEDCVVSLLPNLILLTNPGASSRNGEKTIYSNFIRLFASNSPQIKVEEMEGDDFCDGGDLLRVGGNLFVGVGGRTNTGGFERLKEICDDNGLCAVPVFIGKNSLHLKSLVTWLGSDIGFVAANNDDGKDALGTILRKTCFTRRHSFIDNIVGANMLRVDNTVIHHPHANIDIIRKENPRIDFVSCDVSELNKVDGALTCCSVVIEYKEQNRFSRQKTINKLQNEN